MAVEARRDAEKALANWEIGRALESIWSLVRRANQYLEQSEPWRLARDPEQGQRLDTVLASAAESLRLLAVYLAPFIPTTSAQMLAQLGLPASTAGDWERLGTWGAAPLGQLGEIRVLFPRFEEEPATFDVLPPPLPLARARVSE